MESALLPILLFSFEISLCSLEFVFIAASFSASKWSFFSLSEPQRKVMMENKHKTESIAKKSVGMGMEENRRLCMEEVRRGLAMGEN